MATIALGLIIGGALAGRCPHAVDRDNPPMRRRKLLVDFALFLSAVIGGEYLKLVRV